MLQQAEGDVEAWTCSEMYSMTKQSIWKKDLEQVNFNLADGYLNLPPSDTSEAVAGKSQGGGWMKGHTERSGSVYQTVDAL